MSSKKQSPVKAAFDGGISVSASIGSASGYIKLQPKKVPYKKLAPSTKSPATKIQSKKTAASISKKVPYKKMTPGAQSLGVDKGTDSLMQSTMTTTTDLEISIPVLQREDSLKFGWAGWYPDWLQCCRRPWAFLIILGLVIMVQGFFIQGVLPASASSLSARFYFTTSDIGLIRMSYDCGIVLALLPIMLLNYDASRPRHTLWLATSCLIMSAGAFLCVLPHPIVGQYEFVEAVLEGETHLCGNRHHGHDERDHGNVNYFKFLFMLGTFLVGIGGAPFFTVGIAFIDENISEQKSILYTGILGVCFLVGSILGYATSAGLLKNVYCEIGAVLPSNETLNSDNPNWVGAWWLAMLIPAMLFALCAIPLFGYPRLLPSTRRDRSSEDTIASKLSGKGSKKSPSKGRVETEEKFSIWPSVKACLYNPTYVGLVIEQCVSAMLGTSLATFLPVYMKGMFSENESPSWVLDTGVAIVLTFAVFGSMVGTLMQRYLFFRPAGNLRFSLATALATMIFLGTFLICTCPETQLAGTVVKYPLEGDQSFSGTVEVRCNEVCQCSQDHYSPVCYVGPRQSITFFSQCYAGCRDVDEAGNLVNCTCVPLTRDNYTEGGGQITTRSRCKAKCGKRVYAFMIGASWAAMFIFMRINPIQQCILKCISFNDRLVGLGMSALFSRLFGAVPAPGLFGWLFEKNCRIWRTAHDTQKLVCEEQNKEDMAMDVFVFSLVTTIIGIVGLAVAGFFYERPFKPPCTKRARAATLSRNMDLSTDRTDTLSSNLSH